MQYGYTGSTNRYRFSTQTYPSGRVISYGFGTASAIDDKLNRLTSISAGTSTLATYTYLGQSGIVKTDYPVPAMALDLWGGTTGVFAGLDRFGRTIDHRWQATGLSSIDLDRYRYGYDRNANPLYRQHYIATDSDELYTYDRFDRLTSMKRGALNSAHDALTATPVVEAAWTLDRLGNWLAYQTKVAGTTDLAQTRTANKVNEITAVTNTTGPTWANIAYDAAGNMTTAPKGEDETTLLKYAYDGWNRLVKVKDASDALIATYAYDGTGRRIKKAPPGSARLTEHTYYNASYQAVEVRSSLTVNEQTVFDPKYVDAVLVRYRDTDPEVAGMDETLFFTHDRMFNVTGVWDASRTAVERYRYTPYGERTVLDETFTPMTGNANTVDQLRGHKGLRMDRETGNHFNRTRYRNPTLGTFDGRDALNYATGAKLYPSFKSSQSVHVKSTNWCSQPAPGPATNPNEGCNFTEDMTDDQICAEAKRCHLDQRQGAKYMGKSGDDAGVICLNGGKRKVPCVWWEPAQTIKRKGIEQRGSDPQFAAFYTECLKRHEQIHIDDTERTECSAGDGRQIFKPGKRNAGEAEAHQDTVDCLKSKRAQCTTEDCRTDLDTMVGFEEEAVAEFKSMSNKKP